MLDGPVDQFSITVEIQLTDNQGTESWPNGAIFGINPTNDSLDGIQFIFLRSEDPKLAKSGYRIIQELEETAVESFFTHKASEKIRFSLDFHKGV